MRHFILLDKDNWINSMVSTDCDFDIRDHIGAVSFVETTYEMYKDIRQQSLTVKYDGKDFTRITDKKRMWKRVRNQGLHSKSCNDYLKNIASIESSILPEEKIGQSDIKDMVPIRRKFKPIFSGEVSPGLIYRLSTEDEIDIWVKQMVDSKLYSEQEAFESATDMLSNVDGWPVVTEYNGEILQLEYFLFNEDGVKVYGGFASHINKSRPHWFWNKFGKLLLESFSKLGIEKVDISVSSKYPAYVEFIKKTYSAIEMHREEDSKFTPLRYNVSEALKNLPADPERKSLGKDWVYKNGTILIREGSEADFPDINKYISKLWKDSSRKDLVNKVFNDTWNLDNASILMMYDDGILINVQTIRQRTESLCGVAFLCNNSNIAIEKRDIIFEGKHLWEKQVGYKEEAFFIEDSFLTHPTLIKRMESRGDVIKHHDLPTGKVVEFISTL